MFTISFFPKINIFYYSIMRLKYICLRFFFFLDMTNGNLISLMLFMKPVKRSQNLIRKEIFEKEVLHLKVMRRGDQEKEILGKRVLHVKITKKGGQEKEILREGGQEKEILAEEGQGQEKEILGEEGQDQDQGQEILGEGDQEKEILIKGVLHIKIMTRRNQDLIMKEILIKKFLHIKVMRKRGQNLMMKKILRKKLLYQRRVQQNLNLN